MQIPQTWDVLEKVIKNINYTRDPLPDDWPGSRFNLVRRNGDIDNYALLEVYTYNPNTYNRDRMRYTRHEFVVPVATYHEMAWVRWVHDRILSIEVHETEESFEYKGVRIYAPHHGNGWDPYTQWYDGHPDEQAKAPGDK